MDGANVDMQTLQENLEHHMAGIAKMFQPHCQLTLVMRNPEAPNGDLILTRDDPRKVIAAIERLTTE